MVLSITPTTEDILYYADAHRVALLDPLGGGHGLVEPPALLALRLLGLLGHVHRDSLANLRQK